MPEANSPSIFKKKWGEIIETERMMWCGLTLSEHDGVGSHSESHNSKSSFEHFIYYNIIN